MVSALEKHAPPPTASTGSHSDPELVSGSMNEAKLLRKLDLKLLPAVSILYLLSFLDRSNVANARIEGLTTDVHMTGNQYLTGLTLYFVGYVLLELPCNIVLKRTTPRFWLPSLTIAWGIVATLMGVTQNLAGFFVVRFLHYLSMWYKRDERQYRISLFFSAASLAGAFGGILAWGIAHMHNEGLLTILVATAAYWFISNYPNTASWLSQDEREFVLVPGEFSQAKLPPLSSSEMTMMTRVAQLTSLNEQPTIIKDMGYTSAQSQLLTIPPYAVATLFTVFWALLSERYKRRALFIVVTSSVAMVGYIILLANQTPKAHPGISYLGTFFAAVGIYPSVALVLCWPAINVSGQTKRATANALQISIGNLGAVLGTQLYRPHTAPRYVVGHSFALAYLCVNIVVVTSLLFIPNKENKLKERHLVEHPETAGFHDTEADLRQGDRHARWIFQV
ncbi:hypothetical protein ACEQ8H_005735 [Pleosporales sp. CAS-2024a]